MSFSESESASFSPILAALAGSASPAESSMSPPPESGSPGGAEQKRQATADGAKAVAKVTKRRAARACASCRARKVRCDVVEGAPCGNCRWDNVECIVQESRRRKKHLIAAQPAPAGHVSAAEALRPARKPANGLTSVPDTNDRRSGSGPISLSVLENSGGQGAPLELSDGHIAQVQFPDATNSLHKLAAGSGGRLAWPDSALEQAAVFGNLRTAEFLNSLDDSDLLSQLPAFVRPLPDKIVAEDVRYLHSKGALTLPSLHFQNALIRAYVEFVHPYMPLIELHDFLNTVNARDGLFGQVSLFLYQAIMFAATAFVDEKYLLEAGFTSRRAARKAFFLRTRLLYDFDYESDRLVLVQALLLMTYWYETPDDQKDTWHWMGVAVSLAHTIGLHRNPATMAISFRRQKLWKRIWWSCFMRDRLIALGMRRPTRIKDEDFDVPMLVEDDFEIDILPSENTVLGAECPLVRDLDMQRDLAIMCVEKAKLCVCISHMLLVQYSMLNRDGVRPDTTTHSTMMLFPNKNLDNVENVSAVDLELMAWNANLPACCQYRPLTPADAEGGKPVLAVQRDLLHMVYQTTISALHRPQFLPASPSHAPRTSAEVQEISRMRVRDAASQITAMAAELNRFELERFLPTTGVTVILPAMIIHLLEMKSAFPAAREKATVGFRACMRVMEKLREIYAAADFATGFLQAALRKAAIDIGDTGAAQARRAALARQQQQQQQQLFQAQKTPHGSNGAKNLQGVLAPGLNLGPAAMHTEDMSTPPPDTNAAYLTPSQLELLQQAGNARHGLNVALNGSLSALPPHALAGHSPAQTDAGHVLTPSASGSSEAPGLLDLDFDFAAAGEGGGSTAAEFDWTAIAGSKLDFEDWLEFPAGEAGAAGTNNNGNAGDDKLMSMFAEEQGREQQMDVPDVAMADIGEIITS